ncbi:TPA_asm: OxaA precursor [Listeria monocytogenes]|nr:OxaA precursor [Listeria monocytogenes]HAA2930734.1 OxaA precursor [Listeria monocytogenes]HAA2966327.1 OxaA precursor [Listeria monocytogenes]HAA4195033.1 OxaA precursor [Listeria monocytogenes]HAA4225216.1 OxaA precursor [Listeria monocytogenes]
MKKKKRFKQKLLIASLVIGLMAVLSGCAYSTDPITSESTGFWSHYIVFPLSWTITWFSDLFGGSYAVGIIVVTILIRLLIMPLMIKQLKSQKAMTNLQPKIKELQEKYSSKDNETKQKLQQETMRLYQENSVNPMMGCLPLLIQMPILLGFYQAISRTAEIKTDSFLWMQLGNPDPYYILPVVAALTTFLSSKISMMGQTQQNKSMAMIVYIMPVMILFMGITLPSALALYWIIGNIFTVFQTLLINNPFKNKREQEALAAAQVAEDRLKKKAANMKASKKGGKKRK